MRRLVITELGTPPGFEVVEEEDPTPGPGEVLLGIEACGFGFVDALMAAGEYQIKLPPPFTLGSEAVGRVVALGEGVDGVAVGDRVASYVGIGGFATRLKVAASAVVAVPDEVEATLAAAVPSSYCTALFAFTERTSVQPGRSVLVLGAGGGLGLAAIDVARSLGASTVVAAASSPEKRAAAAEQGADVLVDYTTEDLAATLKALPDGGVDVVYDPVGGEHAFQAFRGLRPDGTFLVVGFAAGDIPSFPLNRILLQNRAVLGVDFGARAMGSDPDLARRTLEATYAGLADGTFHPPAPTVLPLEQAVDGLVALRERKVAGKVVVDVGG
jgi:NADPH2:quinone reductase